MKHPKCSSVVALKKRSDVMVRLGCAVQVLAVLCRRTPCLPHLERYLVHSDHRILGTTVSLVSESPSERTVSEQPAKWPREAIPTWSIQEAAARTPTPSSRRQ